MHLGLEGLTLTAASFYEVADTGCDAAYRASVQLFTEFEASQNATTIDVSQQASSSATIHVCQHETGLVFVSACFCCVSDVFTAFLVLLDLQWACLQICDQHSTVLYCATPLYHTAAGNLLTVSRRLYLNRQQAQARRLHEEDSVPHHLQSTGRLHRRLHAVAGAQTVQPRSVTPGRHITARN